MSVVPQPSPSGGIPPHHGPIGGQVNGHLAPQGHAGKQMSGPQMLATLNENVWLGIGMGALVVSATTRQN